LSAGAPQSRSAAAAAIAAAAVALSRSGDAADAATFADLVARRASRGTGQYDGLLGAWLGEYFDEPDVSAFARLHGLDLVGP
jgi:hypothetical protein